MEAFFKQFQDMTTEESQCIDITILSKDIEYFAETGLIQFTPRRLSDYEIDFIMNDLHLFNVQLSQDFPQKYLSLRSVPLDADVADNTDTQDTTEDYSNAYPTHISMGFPEEEFTDEERDYDSDVTD